MRGSAFQSGHRLRPHAEQRGSIGRRAAFGSIGTQEPDLPREQYGVGSGECGLKPWRRRAIRNQCNAVTMRKEFVEPWYQAVAAAERRIHPDKPAPMLIKTVVPIVAASGDRHVNWPEIGGRDVHIEAAAKRVENVFRRVPFIRLAEGFPMAHPIHLRYGCGVLVMRQSDPARR